MLLRNPFRKPTAPPAAEVPSAAEPQLSPETLAELRGEGPAASLPEWEDAEEESGPAPDEAKGPVREGNSPIPETERPIREGKGPIREKTHSLGDHGHAPELTQAEQKRVKGNSKPAQFKWGPWEDFLRDQYPKHGAEWCAHAIEVETGVPRTAQQIAQKASALKLKVDPEVNKALKSAAHLGGHHADRKAATPLPAIPTARPHRDSA